MDFFTNYERLCRQATLTPNGVAKILGIPSSSVTQWKNGSTPRAETLQKIAEFFKVDTSYLLFGIEQQQEKPAPEGELVNGDPELTAYIQDLKDRPELRMLFSLTHNATREDVERAVRVIEAIRNPRSPEQGE